MSIDIFYLRLRPQFNQQYFANYCKLMKQNDKFILESIFLFLIRAHLLNLPSFEKSYKKKLNASTIGSRIFLFPIQIVL